MRLNKLLEAFARKTYPDNELLRLMKLPIGGNYMKDGKLLGQLQNYFMDEEKDLRHRLMALKKYDVATLGHEEDVYNEKTLEDAMWQVRDNAVPNENR